MLRITKFSFSADYISFDADWTGKQSAKNPTDDAIYWALGSLLK